MSRDPRVLIYDLEVSRWTATGYGKKWDPILQEFTEQQYTHSMAWKWLGDTEVHFVGQRDFTRSYKRNKSDDRQLMGAIHDVMAQADVRIGHNIIGFDEKVARTRMAINGITNLPAIGKHSLVDTLRVARANFALPSYKLDDIAEYFGLGRKLVTPGRAMWRGVAEGDMEAWDVMEAYNRTDVELTEDLYLFLRDGGWITKHPNLAHISGRPDVCTHCMAPGSELVRRGFYKTGASTFVKYRCNVCGSYQRGPKAERGKGANLRPIG